MAIAGRRRYLKNNRLSKNLEIPTIHGAFSCEKSINNY
jgi:hypothetical protein